MRILTSYLIRAHVGPFLFALSALTGLLFLNAVAQRLEDLAGKGLTADVILEFLYLSLPHTLALTLPMAVLVAVLYAFSELAANNEVTAMKAGGVRPQRTVLPLLVVGVVVAGGMLYFNDQVLPEANHSLKNLLIDINRKSPTFTLREQVVNEIRTGTSGQVYYLTSSTIDDEASELHGVTLYDTSDPLAHRTIYAERGTMAFNEARTDLYLTLHQGVIYEASDDPPGSFGQNYFETLLLPLRGIGNEMERQAGGATRGDREMSMAMLADAAAEREAELQAVRDSSLTLARTSLDHALGYGGDRYALPDHEIGRDPLISDALVATRGLAGRSEVLTVNISQKRVEIHKKLTLAFACIVFVLVGAPLAVRFPRGGLGLVIAASSGIFAVYWMGLIGGESLADRGVAPPGVTMWIPNAVFTLLGLWLLARMGREAATNRGGGWEDLFYSARALLSRPFRGRGQEGTPASATSP